MIFQVRRVPVLYVVLVISLSLFLYLYHICIKQKFQQGIQTRQEVPIVKTLRSEQAVREIKIETTRLSTPLKTTAAPKNLVNLTRNISRQNLDQTSKDGNVTSVLLLTYLRSGSTFTADLLQQASGMFYVYEPLKKMLPNGYYLKSGQKCFYLNYPETCRNSTEFDKLLDMIASFYDCNFSSKFLQPEKHSDAQVKVKECLGEAHHNASSCNKSVRSLCDASSVRMIKTIRISMDVVEILMKRIPTLKVVHLIRDPRGMHKSRKKGGFLRQFKSRSHDAINACNRYMYDFKVSERLNSTFPNRIKRILYEDLASNTVKYAKDIFTFLSLDFPPNMHDWISNHTSANQKDGYYGTLRANSSAVANEWRDKLSEELIKEIDDSCDAVYDIAGYTPFHK